MKKVLIVIAFSLFLYGCQTATFTKPQPDGVDPINHFPEHLQGNYISKDEASILSITPNMIYRTYDYDVKSHKDSLGLKYEIIGDSLLDKVNQRKQKITLLGDSIIQHNNWTDTVFNISNNNILKKFKGYYFLNTSYNDSTWFVSKLWLKKGVLTVGNIATKDEINALKEITETASDTTGTSFTLTKKQFKKFINSGGFKDEEIFFKVK